MSAVMVIDNYAFTVDHEKTENHDENLMYAMFAFDNHQANDPPIQFMEQYPIREEWLLFLLNHLSEFYGVNQSDILRDWAEYEALPGSATYYRLQELVKEAQNAKPNN